MALGKITLLGQVSPDKEVLPEKVMGAVLEAITLLFLPPALPAAGLELGLLTLSCEGSMSQHSKSPPGWYHAEGAGVLLCVGSPEGTAVHLLRPF